MAEYDDAGRMQIGEMLKSARTRQRLDMRAVEERTKIRTKYLRALEASDWERLPSPAYAKGFLRTYAQILGLDADALVDEFRRQVESRHPAAGGFGGEPVLGQRRRIDAPSSGPSLGPVAMIGAAVLVVFLLLLGLTGGGDDDADRDRAERREARQERQERRQERRRERVQARQGAAGGSGSPVRLRLVMNEDVQVCLVGDARRPLVDGQVLPAGTEEVFEAQRFRLGFPSGYGNDQFRLFVAGERIELPEVTGPAAYRIGRAGRVRQARDPGPGCP